MVPLRIPLKSRNSLPLDRVADEGVGFVDVQWKSCKSRTKRSNVMTVDFCDAKTKCLSLVGKRLHVLHNEGAVVGLLTVVVHDHSQIAQSMLTCTQCSFPDGALV